MVTYSPWIQSENYDSLPLVPVSSTDELGEVLGGTSGDATIDAAIAALAPGLDRWGTGGLAAPGDAGWWIVSSGDPVVHQARAARVTRTYEANDGALFDWPFVDWPEGAQNIEWETDTAAPVVATIYYEFQDISFDHSQDGPPPYPSPDVQARFYFGPSPPMPDLRIGDTDSGTVNLSGLMDGLRGQITLTEEVRKLTPQTTLNPPTFLSTVRGDWQDMRIIYTMRPPRHRFVFAGAPQPQPLRVLPRDDGLVTASAARVWPPARSVQHSNRRGPGSYM